MFFCFQYVELSPRPKLSVFSSKFCLSNLSGCRALPRHPLHLHQELRLLLWLLLDGVDSGFSIDAIEDLKRGLFDTIFEMYPDKEIYIIVSANEYEMARGEMCFDVVNCRYVNIKSYDRYRKIVMKSREYKDARIEAVVKRNLFALT